MTGGGHLSHRPTVVHVVPSLHPSAGGPSRTVVQLTDALAKRSDIKVSLLSQALQGDPSVGSVIGEVDRRVLTSSSSSAIKLALPLRQQLTNVLRQSCPDVVHSHGLWTLGNHWASRAARRSGIPLIIHPRGMLEPWALQYKAWKKRIGMALFQRQHLEAATVLIATSSLEYENIRKLDLRQPIAVIPNGVSLATARDVLQEPRTFAEQTRNVLFLSRVHPKKGLLNLIEAWGHLAPPDWRLRIAGPNEGAHLDQVMARARQLGIQESVDYLGEVDGEQKIAAYRDADLFVLPTFSENFGVVVAEALANGVPVITTRGAPWADLETHRCGWWINIGVDPLVEALRSAMALSDDERRAIGARGREYVRRYDWDTIARDTVAVYSWAVGGEPRPDFVIID